MRNRSLGTLLVLAILLICAPGLAAQNKKSDAPSKAAGSGAAPDLSGVWMRDAPPATAQQYWIYELNQEEPPMTDWGLAQFKAAKSSFGSHEYPLEETNDPVLRSCYPPGVPRVYMHPFPFQFIQTPGEVVMLFEVDSLRREIYTDGQRHDPSLVPLWMGNSIGHWEGDTLVVDTNNFNDRTWLDRIGHPHSDQLHVIERFRRIDHDHLVDEITIDDPKAYTKPWTARLQFVLKSWKLTEQFCEDGESFMSLEKKEASEKK
ncbi:MAG TPA: hypothetical protein VKV15_09665 [Bryobacteraceae bacterium]|nr:hypothetical protein [Bryobacteraceae bacterium]